MESAYLPTILTFANAENHIYLSCVAKGEAFSPCPLKYATVFYIENNDANSNGLDTF